MSTFASKSHSCKESTLPAPIYATHSSAPPAGLQALRDEETASSATSGFAHDFSRVPVHRQGPTSGPVGSQTQPFNTYLFCTPPFFDSAQIRTALSTAKTWVGTVVAVLDLFKMGRLTGTRETAVRIALRENFNITDPFPRFSLTPRPVDTLLANFQLIETALNQPLQFYCTHACAPGDLAWVLTNSATTRLGLPPGIINVCPEFFGCDPRKQASTIVHERAHEALGADDIAYEGGGMYDALPTAMALNNADSYGVFARQVYHNGLYRPGLSCSIANSRIPDFHLTEPTLQMPRPRPPSLMTPSLLPPD